MSQFGACQTQAQFELRPFLQDVIEDKIKPVHAYNKDYLKRAKEGEENMFYKLIVYCLEFLHGEWGNEILYDTLRIPR
jgi:hypothetical protein